MPSIQASFDAFATYHAVVAPVLGTDPAAVDAGLVEAALDAVLAKRPSPTYIARGTQGGLPSSV